MNPFLCGRQVMLALVTASAIAATAAHAQTYNKVMVAGGTLLVGHFANVNPDCSSRGPVDVRLLNGPSSGTIRIVHTADYGHFTGDFEHCNTRRVVGESIYYTPQRGFIGSDSVQIDVFYPNGTERTGDYTITVK